MKKTIVLTLLLMALTWIGAGWLAAQRPELPPHPTLLSQEAVDAVQSEKISELQAVTDMHSMILVELQADRNWLMGGIAMVGGLFVLVQLMQFVQIRKRP